MLGAVRSVGLILVASLVLAGATVADAQAVTGTARLHLHPRGGSGPSARLEFTLPSDYRQIVGAIRGEPMIGRYRRHVATWTGLSCAVELTVIGIAQPRPPALHGRVLVNGAARLRVSGSGRRGDESWYVGMTHTGWQNLTDGDRLTGVATFPLKPGYRRGHDRWAVVDMGVVAYADSAPDGGTRRQRQLQCDAMRDAAAEEIRHQLTSVHVAGRNVLPPPGIENEAAATLGPLLWSEEFNGKRLDPSRWSYRANGLRHDGILTPSAVSVGNGMLTIKTYTESGNNYSGMISTQEDGFGGFEQKYGYFEARMRFSSGPGQWSAFWLQSPTIGNPLGDPAAAGVEIDVVEHRVHCDKAPSPAPQDVCGQQTDISDRVQHGLIWDGYGNDSKWAVQLSDPWPALGNGSWHRWALRWTPSQLKFYYDGAPIWSMSGPISQRSQFIILSSEVGKFMAGELPQSGYGSRDATTTNVQVDYVRVWALR